MKKNVGKLFTLKLMNNYGMKIVLSIFTCLYRITALLKNTYNYIFVRINH